MKSARIWLRGERKQRRVGLLLQGTLRISLSYTYFMVEQSFRTCRLLEQVSATEEPSVRPQTIPYTCTLQSQDDSFGGVSPLATTKDTSCTLRSNCTHVFCGQTSALEVESRHLTRTAINVNNQIPFGRGLGSSGAAVTAGVLLADALAELHLSMLDFALMVERHPDNVTAALIGGFVGSYLRELDDDAQARAQVPLNPARCD